MMGATGMSSSSIATQRASPWPRQLTRWSRSCNSLPCFQKLDALPRVRYCVLDRARMIPTERCRFGAVGSRFLGSEEAGLGLVSSRTAAVRAQEEGKEGQELEKAEKKSTELWASSIQRANTVTRIFMGSLVWICLLLWISVTNSETGGGRPSRRGPRK